MTDFDAAARDLLADFDALDRDALAPCPARLRALATRLDPIHLPMADLARELAGAIETQGAPGSWAVTADGYPGVTRPTPAQQGLYDALLLRAADPELGRLAGLLAYHAEASVEDYPRQVVVSALLEASLRADPSLSARLDDIELARVALRGLPVRAAGEVRTYYTVQPGDGIQDVAEMVLGRREDWPELARLYGLVPPYISELGARDGVLAPGQRLQLPREQERRLSPGAGLGKTLRLRREDGRSVDFDLDDHGNLAFDEGLGGFASDIALRAMTPLGDLPDLPEYGVPLIAGEDATLDGATRALLESDSLYQDSRVGLVRAALGPDSSAPRGVLVNNLSVLPRPDLV